MATEGTGADCARDLGIGWKVSPSVEIAPGEIFTMADIEGPGAIQHIWLTCFPTHWRNMILRMYWDEEEQPSVEVPLGDFFCNGWQERCDVNSQPIAVNPAGGMNSYWLMPFRKHATITIENKEPDKVVLYYQVDYTLTEVPEDMAYFHAQWRRSNPVPYGEVHTILDGVSGKGQYIGTYLAWQVNNTGWWGKVKSSFTWTVTSSSRRFAERVRKIISAERGTGNSRSESIRPIPPHIWGCISLLTRTAYTAASNGSECIDGIF